jgi:hypothetical protein
MGYEINEKAPASGRGFFYFWFNCSGLAITPTQWGCLLFCIGYVVFGLDKGICWGIWSLIL